MIHGHVGKDVLEEESREPENLISNFYFMN